MDQIMNFDIKDKDKAAINYYFINNNVPDIMLILRDIVTSKPGGINYVSQKTGLSRDGIYKTLSRNGNPKLDTLLLILDAIGLSLFSPDLNAVISTNKNNRDGEHEESPK